MLKLLVDWLVRDFVVAVLKREGKDQWKDPDQLCFVKFTVALKLGHRVLLFPEQTGFTLLGQLKRSASMCSSKQWSCF